jgi:Flp pilus assembly protein TadB
MTTLALMLIAIIGIPLLIAALMISGQKRRIHRESRALDEMLFRKEEED